MPPRQARLACRTHFGRPNRYKTLPTHAPGRRYRYKTLPARARTPIVAHFQHAGRTLYRSHHQQVEQGELCTAFTTHTTSRENFVPHAGPMPVQNSPRSQPSRVEPVQNSPRTPKMAHFSTYYASRENFIPLSPPTGRAGRTLYRFHHPHDEQGEKSPAPTLRLTHQRAPPPISHAIRLLELSIIPRNVTIPTI